MNICTAIAGIGSPSRSRRSTSISRGLSASRSVASRRRDKATARPEAVNDEAATAECLIATSTSSTGAAFATNADTPVSKARNSTSSSSRDARTTMPRSVRRSRSSRASRRPSPSGKLTFTVTTSGRAEFSIRGASAADTHSATISISGWRLISSRKPNRIRVWLSMTARRIVIVDLPPKHFRVPSAGAAGGQSRAARHVLTSQNVAPARRGRYLGC